EATVLSNLSLHLIAKNATAKRIAMDQQDWYAALAALLDCEGAMGCGYHLNPSRYGHDLVVKQQREGEEFLALPGIKQQSKWRWPDVPYVESFSKSRDICPVGISDQVQYSFNSTRRSQNRDPQRRVRSISPSMRNPFSEGYDIANVTIKYLVAVRDAHSPVQNGDMFVLSFMNMHRRAIAGVGYDFDHRIQTLRVFR